MIPLFKVVDSCMLIASELGLAGAFGTDLFFTSVMIVGQFEELEWIYKRKFTVQTNPKGYLKCVINRFRTIPFAGQQGVTGDHTLTFANFLLINTTSMIKYAGSSRAMELKSTGRDVLHFFHTHEVSHCHFGSE